MAADGPARVAALTSERTQPHTVIERIKEALPRMTDAEQAEATREIGKLEQFYELISPRKPSETPYRNQYRCPYGEKNCGENAKYCGRCNEDCEKFLLILNDDR
jgi:hypothetical protein